MSTTTIVMRRRFRDRTLAPRVTGKDLEALYADLVERMLAAAQELHARQPTTDQAPIIDVPVRHRSRSIDEDKGHEFHGNQWTGGLGSKPKEVKAKTAKAAVHELLSSGHPFSKAELMSIAGVKTEKLLGDYLAMLKNPKYAGPQGALNIAKKGDQFYVAFPDGTPAPALPKQPEEPKLPPHLQKLAEKMEKAAPSHTITEVKVPGYTEPETKEQQALKKAEEFLKGESPYVTAVTKLSGAHPGSMPKGEADALYQQAMSAANVYLAHGVKQALSPAYKHEAVLKWKNQKAAAMAAWAQAVSGHIGGAKKQEMFKADEHLAQMLSHGVPISQALDEWKKNTALEKAGNFPPKTGAEKAKETKAANKTYAESLKVAGDMGSAAPVQPVDYHALVPDGHQPIGAADFLEGKGYGHWASGISSLKSDLAAESANAQANKKGVEQKLRERLKDKPNFQALVKRLGLVKEGPMSLESRLIQTWAGSSGDNSNLSVAMQMAVRDAFGIPDGHIEKAALSALKNHGHDVDALTKAAIQSINGNITALQSHEVQTARAALQEFVQAQYEETQSFLASKGHDHVYLARGMKVHTGHDNAKGAANLKLQPASSFSANYATANSFAGHGTVFLVKVPRQQVLSTYMTGFGCTSEHEVVVIAHDKLKAFTMSSGITGAQGAAMTVGEQLKKAGHVAKPAAKPSPSAVKSGAGIAGKQPAPASGTKTSGGDPLKQAVINTKSKAAKAAKAAEKFKGTAQYQAKVAHAQKAAQEAAEAVKAYNAAKGKK